MGFRDGVSDRFRVKVWIEGRARVRTSHTSITRAGAQQAEPTPARRRVGGSYEETQAAPPPPWRSPECEYSQKSADLSIICCCKSWLYVSSTRACSIKHEQMCHCSLQEMLRHDAVMCVTPPYRSYTHV